MPDDTHIDLQQTVAALRQELAASRAERDAGLAREAALAEVVQTTNSSPGDLTPVPTLFLQRCTPFAASSMARWSPMTANIFAWRRSRHAPISDQTVLAALSRRLHFSGWQNMVDQGVIDRLEGVYDR